LSNLSAKFLRRNLAELIAKANRAGTVVSRDPKLGTTLRECETMSAMYAAELRKQGARQWRSSLLPVCVHAQIPTTGFESSDLTLANARTPGVVPT
jgi:hypothetical protein